jgi:hypothetical protein
MMKRGFWQTFWGMTIRPGHTMREVSRDPVALQNAFLLLALIIGVYTLILAIFISEDYPAAAPSILPLSVKEQYPAQIWYQGPLFVLSTVLTAGVLVLAGRSQGELPSFRITFTRVTYASIVPFFFTTMLIELVIALLLLLGLAQPEPVLSWLLGPGAWFPAAYQLVAMLWIVVLFVMAAWHTLKRNWPGAVLGGLLALAVYSLPVALLIR